MGEHTKVRGVRIPDDLWNAALEKAEREGTTVSEALRAFLTRWVKM